jgi:hypothetical protein
MSELAVFVFGCLVTSICLAAVTLLLWGAYQDGEVFKGKPRTGE